MTRQLNIPATNLRVAAINPTFKRALAAIVIIKLRYLSSTIHHFSLKQLRDLLHCEFGVASSIYEYLTEEGYATLETRKDGEKRLTVSPLPIGEKCHSICLHAEKTAADGMYIYIPNEKNVKITSSNATLHSVEKLIDEACLLNFIYLYLTRKRLIERRKATKKNLSRLSMRTEELKKKEDENRKTESVKRISPLAQFCPDEVKKSKKLFAGTKGFDYSIYDNDGISQDQLVKWCFDGTLSLSTVKRRLKSLIDKGVMKANRHGRVVAQKWNEDLCDEDNGDPIASMMMHWTNVFGEDCPSYMSKRAKFVFNNCRENKSNIAKDHGEAACCAWWQPWPNSYVILCAAAIKVRRSRKKKGGKAM